MHRVRLRRHRIDRREQTLVAIVAHRARQNERPARHVVAQVEEDVDRLRPERCVQPAAPPEDRREIADPDTNVRPLRVERDVDEVAVAQRMRDRGRRPELRRRAAWVQHLFGGVLLELQMLLVSQRAPIVAVHAQHALRGEHLPVVVDLRALLRRAEVERCVRLCVPQPGHAEVIGRDRKVKTAERAPRALEPADGRAQFCSGTHPFRRELGQPPVPAAADDSGAAGALDEDHSLQHPRADPGPARGAHREPVPGGHARRRLDDAARAGEKQAAPERLRGVLPDPGGSGRDGRERDEEDEEQAAQGAPRYPPSGPASSLDRGTPTRRRRSVRVATCPSSRRRSTSTR